MRSNKLTPLVAISQDIRGYMNCPPSPLLPLPPPRPPPSASPRLFLGLGLGDSGGILVQAVHGVLHVCGLSVGGHRGSRLVGGGQAKTQPQPVEVSTGWNLAGGQLEAGGEVGGVMGSVLWLWEATEILELTTEQLWQQLVVDDVRELRQAGGLAVGYSRCGCRCCGG